MKQYQNLYSEEDFITPSEVIEFLYCKRFTYFMKVLDIKQYEEKRFKVQLGRDKHRKKEIQNKDYLRKRLGVEEVFNEKYLVSKEFRIKGKVDQILRLKDGIYAPLDYKFAEYKEKDFETYNIQMIMYSIMIEEMFNAKVEKYYLVYLRSKSYIKEVEITEKDKLKVKKYIKEYLNVLKGIYPKGTISKRRCIDCCYKNIC